MTLSGGAGAFSGGAGACSGGEGPDSEGAGSDCRVIDAIVTGAADSCCGTKLGVS